MLVELIENPILISALLLSMFIISGFNKLFNFKETVDSFTKKLKFSNTVISNFIITLVILLEIIAPLLIIYYFISGSTNCKKYAYYSAISLCIFTILATILYHPPKMLYKKSLGFWANLTLIGGLLLLAKYINQK